MFAKIRASFLAFLILSSLMYADEYSEFSIEDFSLFIEENQEISFQNPQLGQWYLYSGTFSNDNFQLNFPNAPETIKTNKNGIYIKSTEANVHYSLTMLSQFGAKPIEKNKTAYLNNLVQHLQNDSVLISFKIYNIGENAILDVFLHHREGNVYIKQRTILSSNNIYFLITSFPANAPEQHELFADSLQITKIPTSDEKPK